MQRRLYSVKRHSRQQIWGMRNPRHSPLAQGPGPDADSSIKSDYVSGQTNSPCSMTQFEQDPGLLQMRDICL